MRQRTSTLYLLLISGLITFFAHSLAFAVPSRKEAYRSSDMKTVVYKDIREDGSDGKPPIYWYIPPIKLLSDKGKVTFYKRDKGDRVDFYFYVVPYMNQDLLDFLTYEIQDVVDTTQLRPILARQFGIQLKNHNVAGLGDKLPAGITDQQYLNTPHEVKISLLKSEVEDFEFFLTNKPGIPASVLLSFESERETKYLDIKLTHKEIFNAMKMGGNGKLYFTKAEIEKNVTDYITTKYFEMKSKGDLPMTDIINKVIQECFTPTKKPTPLALHLDLWLKTPYDKLSKLSKKNQERYRDSWMRRALLAAKIREPEESTWGDYQLNASTALDSDEIILPKPGSYPGTGTKPPVSGGGSTTTPGGSSGSVFTDGNAQAEFKFKKDLANSDVTFFYHHSQFADASETVLVPFFLSSTPTAATESNRVTMLPKQQIVVGDKNSSSAAALATNIVVNKREQYVISATMSISAESRYKEGLLNYRWESAWPSTDGDLYYRIGNGPWTPVNKRAMIKAEGLYKGELQFYLDREKIWSKLPKDYRESDVFGLVPAIFTYQKFFPRFYVTVNGRRFETQE